MKTIQNITTVLAFFLATANGYSQESGKELFSSNCASCHSIGSGQVVGPDLKGVHNRYKEAWLLKWIKSSQTLVQNKDPKAVAVFQKFNEIQMPDVALSEAQIKDILAYIKQESGDIPALADKQTDGISPATQAIQTKDINAASTITKGATIGVAKNISNLTGTSSIQTATVNNSYLWVLGTFILILLTIIFLLAQTISSLLKLLQNAENLK